jgi:hypothetical protein
MIKSFVMIAALMSTNAAAAETAIGTMGTKGYPITSGGVLNGCAVEFDNIHTDRVYLPAKMIAVSGSIALYLSEKGGGYGFKVVVNDSAVGPEGVTVTPNPPFSINIETASGTSTHGLDRKQLVSETPGGTFVTFEFFDEKFSKIMDEIMDTQSATILFNRRDGGMDIRVPIDFTVASTDEDLKKTRNNSTMKNFIDCNVKLLSKVSAEIK